MENQLAQQKQQVANDQQTVNDLQSQVNADKEQIKNDTPTALQQKLEQDQAKFDELRKVQVSPEEIQKAQDAYNDAVKALNYAQSQMNKDNDTLAKAQQAYIKMKKNI
ncbi:hypothetical protein [Ligilactobacillus sp. LYQ60]|uniref:hypothetical protein n=1 Tax=unclassified Ligilactobacillus TaxID=2767920 RepID=UPI0038541DC6